MKIYSLQIAVPTSLAFGATLLAACSGSAVEVPGSGIEALSAPAGVSLVEPDDSNVQSGTSGTPPAGLQFPANSAYVTDAASIRLFDPALKSVQSASNILCELGLTSFGQLVNAGAYTAQVDPSLCGNGPDANQSDSQETNLHIFTVDSTRASNTDPQEVKLWLPLLEGGQPVLINATITVNEAPSAADPYGDFAFSYAGVADGGSIDTPAINAAIASATGEPGFRFVDEEGDVDVPAANPGDSAERTQVTVIRNVDGTGAAKITNTVRFNDGSGDSGQVSTTTRVVYDDTHVLKQIGADAPIALSRGDFRDNVYAYNLYYADGANQGDRVAINSGVGITFAGGEYGWVGYHGAWAEFPESFDNGDLVTGTDDDTPYTVVAAPGRLMKYTEASIALTELGSQHFEWYDGTDQFLVSWTGTDWTTVAVWDQMNESFTEINPPVVIDVSATGGFLNMYSPFLGPVSYVDGDADMSYFDRSLVNGSSDLFVGGTPVDLYASIEGLKGEITQTEIDNGDIYLATPANISNANKYVIDPADMTLQHDVVGDGSNFEQVGLADGITPNGGPNQWGMRSGRMVTSVVLATMSNPEDFFGVSEFYIYETGHNEWNKFVGLTDATGAYVTFDEPIEFLYAHSQANDINDDATYDGQQVLLQYGGPGRMWGIPGEQVDVDGDGNTDQYLPNFSIADGTIVGPNGEYIVRAIGVDQTLVVAGGGAPQLDIADADALTIPDPSLYVTPDIGAQPNITSPPRVIDGEVQEQ